MTPEVLSAQLQSVFGCGPLPLADGSPRALRTHAGEVLELRYSQEPQALCAALPLGRLNESRREEALVRLLRTDLHLAHVGSPHLALAPHDAQVYFCCTLPLEGDDAPWLVDRLQRLVSAAPQMREALASEQVLGA